MEIKIFENKEFGEIRTTNIDGDPWFVGKDVCEAFGDTNHKRSLANIDDSDRCISKIDTAGGKQNMVIINESGLYSLLFQMQPQKAKGVSQNDYLIEERIQKLKRFKKWVTSEVLPSIRKNGGYIANQEKLTPEQIVANALIVAQNIISQKDKQIEELKPKAEFFDAVADSKTAISMNEVSKVLAIKGYGRNNLFEFLRSEGILDRYNVPYQRYVDCGWFRVIEQKYIKKRRTMHNDKDACVPEGCRSNQKENPGDIKIIFCTQK